MMRRFRLLAPRVVPALVLTLALPAVVEAHAIHTTLTVLTTSPTGITLNIRAFADDFSASVAKFAGRRLKIFLSKKRSLR